MNQQYPQRTPWTPWGAPPQQEIVTVNGKNGAEAYPMGPNSSALLLDESGLILWVVKTDGAGYKSVAPFDVLPHKEPVPPEYAALNERLDRLEAMISGKLGHSDVPRTDAAVHDAGGASAANANA